MDKRRLKKFYMAEDEIMPDVSLPHIDVDSNKSAVVDGCFGVIEYNSETVRINCRELIVKFVGCDLSIRAISVQKICVSGRIVSIEFCSL